MFLAHPLTAVKPPRFGWASLTRRTAAHTPPSTVGIVSLSKNLQTQTRAKNHRVPDALFQPAALEDDRVVVRCSLCGGMSRTSNGAPAGVLLAPRRLRPPTLRPGFCRHCCTRTRTCISQQSQSQNQCRQLGVGLERNVVPLCTGHTRPQDLFCLRPCGRWQAACSRRSIVCGFERLGCQEGQGDAVLRLYVSHEAHGRVCCTALGPATQVSALHDAITLLSRPRPPVRSFGEGRGGGARVGERRLTPPARGCRSHAARRCPAAKPRQAVPRSPSDERIAKCERAGELFRHGRGSSG